MASSQEIWNEYKQLSSVHYSADDFYDQSFVNRIADAQRKIDSAIQERSDADSKRQQSQDSYDTFFGNMRDYSSLNDEGENKYGVTTAIENYEKAKYAVSATEQMLDALPSTLARNSGVVMSQQRRELAYNAAANQWGKTMDTRREQVDVNKEVWDRARENANAYAEKLYGEQKSTLESLSLQWATNTGLFQQATENVLSAESLKWDVQQDYRNWQWNQANIKNAYARAQAEDAFNRYMVQLSYENTARMEQHQRRMAELELQSRQSKERLAQALVNSYYRQQEAKKTAEIVNAGGILGRLAYLSSR